MEALHTWIGDRSKGGRGGRAGRRAGCVYCACVSIDLVFVLPTGFLFWVAVEHALTSLVVKLVLLQYRSIPIIFITEQ